MHWTIRLRVSGCDLLRLIYNPYLFLFAGQLLQRHCSMPCFAKNFSDASINFMTKQNHVNLRNVTLIAISPTDTCDLRIWTAEHQDWPAPLPTLGRENVRKKGAKSFTSFLSSAPAQKPHSHPTTPFHPVYPHPQRQHLYYIKGA